MPLEAGLEGLLVTSMELDTEPWRASLHHKLHRATEALPRVAVGRLIARAVVPLRISAP